MRQFPDVSGGRSFPSRWDRRQDMSLVLGYELNDRWSFCGTFVYSTGQATTLPVQRYFIEGRVVSQFSERNSFCRLSLLPNSFSLTHKLSTSIPRKSITTGLMHLSSFRESFCTLRAARLASCFAWFLQDVQMNNKSIIPTSCFIVVSIA